MLRSTPLHSGWEFAEKSWTGEKPLKVGTSLTEWLPAEVPGHVHLDLMKAGVIQDPFYRMNELGCQWVDRSDWSYRTTFEFEPDPELPHRVLRFEGLDTVATVFLNGEQVATSNNMFVPLEVDVTTSLKTGKNDLLIEFSSAIRVGEERRTEYFAANGIKVDTANFADRAFVRKAQYMFGWDWGPRLVSCGIWQPVRLIEYDLRILDVHIEQHHTDGNVTLTVSSEVEGSGILMHTLVDPDGEIVETILGDGEFEVEEPELWNPNAAGEPNLYTVLTSVADKQSEDESDVRVTNVGLRTVRLLREPDSFGESFEFEVNGKSLWIRGANWIPDHSFPSTVTRHRYREQIERAVDMGFNMLRVWGGGLYETDAFYDVCDELGVLVWQDFPFGCSYYPDDDDFQQQIADEAYVNAKRLRNHPSLALWCGNNENHQMWHDKWGGLETAPPRYFGLPLYEQTLPAVLAKTDPSRAYIASSAIGATNDGPDENPNRGGYGDQHNWDVWHGRGDWRFYTESTARFSSEYGFASSCSLEVWNEVIDDDQDDDPHSAVVRWHDKTAKGHDTFHGFVKLHYPEPVTLEDWVYYSQLNQRDALRCGVEHYRRSEFCKGSLIWQLNDCWPVQSWAILDSGGHYKALAYELRRLYGNSMCSIVRENDEVRLWVVNDSWEPVTAEPGLRAVHLATGETLMEFPAEEITLQPGERRLAITASIKGLSVPETLIQGIWDGDSTWQLVAEPKAARFAAPAKLTLSTYNDGYLAIETSTPLVDLWLLDEGSTSTFQENFLTLPEPGIFYVRTTKSPTYLEARSLAGEHKLVVTRSPIE